MSELPHVLDASIETGPYSEATPPPTTLSTAVTTRGWPIHHKWIGASRMWEGITHPEQQRPNMGMEILH